jgi:alpha-methylacyl-CoA racemase
MGPLAGYKIIEIAGIGPGQLAGMILAELGAEVIRIDRPAAEDIGFGLDPRHDLMNRSRPIIGVDLKTGKGVDLVLQLCEDADAIFEGFRPGVMERLGLGPNDCMARNEKLVYGRMTGWGQDGPLADTVGHDPNYIALTGIYASIGERGGDPVYPLNLIGDMGGGGTYLVIGMLAALMSAAKSGRGQVVDAAMIDGASSLMTLVWGLKAAGMWNEDRGTNLMDGSAPFATSYRTRDNQYVVIAAVENRFFQNLLIELNIEDINPDRQYDSSYWDEIRTRLSEVFVSRDRAYWCDLLEGTDTCFSPLLTMSEVGEHPHIQQRKLLQDINGIRQPSPAPRFSNTPSEIRSPASGPEQDLIAALEQWGATGESLALARNL